MPHVEVERTITASSVVSRPGYDERLVRPDLYEAHAAVWSRTEALEIDGVLQTGGGLSVRATAVRPLQVSAMHTMSHDFH